MGTRAGVGGLAAALVLSAGGAIAEEGWSFAGPEGGQFQSRAGTCPLYDETTGNYLCLIVGCEEGGPVTWTVSMAGGNLPDRLPVVIEVDWEPVADPMLIHDGDGNWTAPVGGDSDALRALATGDMGALRLGADGGWLTRELSLAGAKGALGHMLDHCGALQPAKAPARGADPVVGDVYANPQTVMRAHYSEICEGELGGQAFFPSGWGYATELGEGSGEDLIFDFGEPICEGVSSPFCGTGGCLNAIFLGAPGDYRLGFFDMVIEMEIAPPELTMVRHGSVCGRAGVEGCVERYLVGRQHMTPFE